MGRFERYLFAYSIWTILFVFGDNLFQFLGFENREIYSFPDFTIDTQTAFIFSLQTALLWFYFKTVQKENGLDAFFRSLVFNLLAYMVYIMLVVRANSV